MRTRVAATVLAVTVASINSGDVVHAGDPVTIMVGGINKILYLPAELTERLGYFKKEGLDVRLLSEPAGVNAENELLAGSVQGVVGFYDHTIDLQTKGKTIESVVQLAKVPGLTELVSRKDEGVIKSAADFKGKTLGVTALGASTSFLTQYLASRDGVEQGQFSMLGVGAGSTFIAAMQQGRIAAGMTSDPTAARLLSTGEAKVLVDLRTEAGTRAALGGVYPAASLYMPNSWANSHKAEVTKLVKAFVMTLQYIHTHTAEQIADEMPRDYYAGNKALYVQALKASLPMFTANGLMPKDGPETVLKVLSAVKTNVKSTYVNLSETYTNTFVKAAER